MNCPKNLQYTKDHKWALIEGDVATIGITDHAQSELGDIVFVELPKAGDAITKNQPFGIIESVKAASELYAPLSGSIVAINNNLSDSPETVNKGPYGTGWVMKIQLSNPAEVKGLLSADEYEKLLGS